MCLGQDAPPTARRCNDAQAHETTTVCMLSLCYQALSAEDSVGYILL